MATKSDVHHNQYLEVNLELQKSIDTTETLEDTALKVIAKTLAEKSSEFSEISKSKSSDALIKVIVWPNEHPKYFAPGTKQEWVKKS
jgi:hypothetical protein